ncbi:hypothetical protein MKX03_035151 [Papaver bracteatum]|nr:hypothetical protein MKX03_035151 [Papaver bracteatum]
MKTGQKGFTHVTPKTVNSSPFTPLKHSHLPSEKKKTIPSLESPCNTVPDGESPYLKAKNVKRAGRIDEHIELLQHKLQLVEDGATYCGKRTKTAKAQGKKYLCSIEHESSRKSLSFERDKNKQCNLAICLMRKGRIMEAKSLLLTVEPPSVAEMLSELESDLVLKLVEQKKDDSFKMETQVKVNSSSLVPSGYVVCESGLEHSDSRVSSTTKVQQTGTRRCLESSHYWMSPVSGQHPNHGLGGKWRAGDSHLSLSPIYGTDSGFGNWKPFGSSKSGKSFADMVEEEERLSRFSDYFANMVDSASGWSSQGSNYMSQEIPTQLLVDKSYEKNAATVYSRDIEDNLQKEFELFDINGEFNKSAARGSLYSDQKQEPESSVQQQYLYLINRHECAGNPTPLRKDRRLQVFKEITLQEDSAEKDMALVMKQLNGADEAIEAVKSFPSLFSQEALDNVPIDLYKVCALEDGRNHGKLNEKELNKEEKLALWEDCFESQNAVYFPYDMERFGDFLNHKEDDLAVVASGGVSLKDILEEKK